MLFRSFAQVVANEKLLNLSRTDELTGLTNRRGFMSELRNRLRAVRENGGSGALIYADLDQFKPINDLFGHNKGDEVLRAVAAGLRETSRSSDIIARIGGDEFAIWLSDIDEPGALAKAQSIRRVVRRIAVRLGIRQLGFGVSLGVVMAHSSESLTTNSLMERADAAMYRVKKVTHADRPRNSPVRDEARQATELNRE